MRVENPGSDPCRHRCSSLSWILVATMGLTALTPARQAEGAIDPIPWVEVDDKPRTADPPEVAFDEIPDGLQITVGGEPFARYIFRSGETTRPFLDRLRVPGGPQVTRNNPPIEGKDPTDHATLHPGVWLAFGDLGGADFWRNKDPIRHVEFVERPRGGAGRGSFVVRNRYEKGSASVAEEVCRLTVLARPAGTLIVWDSEFRPQGGDLVFGDQEEMGLGVRLATPLAVTNGGQLADSEGRINEAQVWGKQADWCRYGGTIEGRRVGVALMTDPANFRRSWFHARDYGLFEANPFGRNAFTGGEKSRVVVPPGETLRLRFGVLVFDGEPDMAAAYRDFLAQLGGSRD